MDKHNINEEYILDRLRNGASVDDLANELTKALNAASKTYNDEKSRKTQMEDADVIAQLIDGYARNYYGGFGIPRGELVISGEELDEIFAFIHDVKVYIVDLITHPEEKTNKKTTDYSSADRNVWKDAAASIDAFLKEYNIR